MLTTISKVPGLSQYSDYISTSLRRGSVSTIANSKNVNILDALERGGWDMRGMSTGFEYIVYSERSQARSARILSGWPDVYSGAFAPSLNCIISGNTKIENCIDRLAVDLFEKVGLYHLVEDGHREFRLTLLASLLLYWAKMKNEYREAYINGQLARAMHIHSLDKYIDEWSHIVAVDWAQRNIEWLSLEFTESVGLRSSELRVSLESFLSHVDVLKAENAALRYSVQALQSNTSEIMKQLTLILSLLQNNSKCFVSPDKSIEDSSSQDSSPDSSQKNAFDTIMNTPQSNEMTSIKDLTLSQALFQSLNTSASITVGMSSSHASQLRRCLRYMHYFSTDEEKSILQTKRPRNTTDEFLIWKKMLIL